jgi:hypothetical protein
MMGRGAWRALAACALGACLAGCSSPLLRDATDGIDAVYTQMVTEQPATPGGALGPRALLATAQVRGPEFLSARLDEAGARLQLDERKAEGAPRFGLSLRRQATARQGGLAVGASDASVAMNWDVAAALFQARDARTLQLAEAYLPVQANLARQQATGRLFEAYFQHEEALLVQRGLQSDMRQARCQVDMARVELDLGQISPAELQAGWQVVSALQQQAAVAERSVQALRREVLYRAGLADTVQLAAGQNPLEAVPPIPPNLTREACYARSGHALRDSLLLEGAAGALRLAKLQRFGRLDVLLPTEISPTGGLDLNLLIAVLVPLVDQRDGARAIQRARRDLLDIALAAERNRRRFDLQLSEAELARAQALVRMDEARNAMAQRAADTSSGCEAAHGQEQARLALRRATIAYQQAGMALALLCSGAGDDAGDSASGAPAATRQILERAAPKVTKGT